MMNLTPLMLKDALREAMRKNNHSVKDVSDLCHCAPQTIYNLINGKISEPTEAIRISMEEYCQAYGMSRSQIMKKMAGPKPLKVITHIKFAKKILKKMIDDGSITPIEFRRQSGMPASGYHSLWHREDKRESVVAKRLLKWLEEKHGLTIEKIREMEEKNILESIGIIAPVTDPKKENGGGIMSSEKPGRHYLCAFLDDWETAVLIGSIMQNHSVPEGQKRMLLGKLFSQEFPTLSVVQ